MGELLANLEPFVLVVVAAAMLAGGFVKGTTGYGLPFITIPILTIAMNVPEAISVSMFPILLANVYQLARAPAVTKAAVARFWPLVVPMVAVLALTVPLLGVITPDVLMIVVGVAAMSFVLFTLVTPNLRVKKRNERWLSPVLGVVSGAIGGLTSFYGTLAVAYVTALKLEKEEFVVTASLILLSGGLTMIVALNRMGFFAAEQALLSTLALVPLYIGMQVGQVIRARISQQAFSRVILLLLAAVGVSMILRGVLAVL